MTSLRRGNDTPSRTAKFDWVMPSGFKNSSRSISPGCVGGLFRGNRRATKPRDNTCGRVARRLLMVVRDLDVVGISSLPAKTHSILTHSVPCQRVVDPEHHWLMLVDADAMLRAPVTFQSFKAVTGRDRQIPQVTRAIDLIELSSSGGP